MSARIYAEGGGNGQLLDALFREAWHNFFFRAGLKGRMPRVVRGKGRGETFDLFKNALKTAKAGDLPILLVDAEDLVAAGHSVWQHLKARDGWDKPDGAADNQAFLMVVVMETWLLADRQMLREYFGAELREQHLKQWPQLEALSKPTVFAALAQATAGCTKPYAKGKVSFELLARADIAVVEAACPSAKALLDRLRAL